jgi:putative peptide zinc metalloprotease protein
MKIRDRLPWAITAALLWIALVACGGQTGATGPDASGATSGAPASASPSQSETPADQVDSEDNHNGDCCKKNVVSVVNKTAGRLKIVSRIQLNRIHGDVVTPVNAAVAVGQSCTGCQTIAVALQLDLYVQGAHNVSPENYAIALNVQCTQCVTIAHAIQFALPVTDPEDDINDGTQAKDAKKILHDMQKELDAIAQDKSVTVDQAEQRVEVVLAEFRDLANSMRDDLKRTTEENSPSSSPSPSASPTASPAASPSVAPPSDTPSATPSATPSSSP